MKKIVIVLLAATAIIGCEPAEEKTELGVLKQQKDSLKKVYAEIAVQIAELDEQIASMDTMEVRVPLVTTSPIEIKGFEHYFVVQGAVEAEKNALVYPEAMGEIVSIRVSEGQTVNKGDVLMELDAKLVRSQIKELETSFSLVKDIYEKQEKLWNQKIGSEMQFLEAKNNKQRMEQSLKTLRAQLDLYIVRAPFSGVVDEIVPKVGEAAAPQMPVMRIVNLRQVYIKSDVSENYISSVKKGTAAKVFFPSIGKSFMTEVKRSGDFITANNRTFKVRFDLDNTEGDLIPNMLADIHILDYQLDSAIVVPSKIIQEDRKNNEYIYVVEGAGPMVKVKKQVIKTGMSYKGETVVVEGLTGKETFIDQGARSVQDGDMVEVAS